MISPAWSSRLALSASAVLALAVVWLLVRMLWLVLGGVAVESAPPLPVPDLAPSSGASGEFRWNLFGRSASPPAVALQPAASTDSRLRLKGVMAGKRGYAIIAVEGLGENVYRTGDALPGGGKIESIEARQVVIRRAGQRETLAFDPAAARARPGGGAAQSGRPAAPAPVELPGIRGLDSSAPASIASLPEAARAFGLDAGQLASSISVMPVAGGGFRVRPGRDARLFRELGFQVNDVVVAVNGQQLTSAQAVQGLFSEVVSSGQVAIRVRRDGREMTLTPDVQEIMGSLQSR